MTGKKNDMALLQLDMDNMVSDMQRLLNAQARIEAKVDAVLSAFTLYALAMEGAGGKFAEVIAAAEETLERRLEEIHDKEDSCEN